VQETEDVRTGKTANCSSAERKYQKRGSLLANLALRKSTALAVTIYGKEITEWRPQIIEQPFMCPFGRDQRAVCAIGEYLVFASEVEVWSA
jgi:hypothetical protein